MPLPPREYDRSLNAEIERLIYQVNVVREEAEGLVAGLSDEQWHWSPTQGAWSIAGCLDHLNVTNRKFLPVLEAGIRDGRAAGRLDGGPYTYGFFSRWVLRQMAPPVKRKFKARRAFQPGGRRSSAEILAEWEHTHERILDLLNDASGLDLAGIKVHSPATRLLRYPLGMAFWIQSAHDRRHLWQARQVRNHASFPAAGG